MARHTTDRDPSLYLELDRKQWRDLRQSMPMVLNENELAELVGAVVESAARGVLVRGVGHGVAKRADARLPDGVD